MGKAQFTFGDTIKAAREKAGWSQQELANSLGASQGTVSRIERGLPVKPAVLQKALDILREYLTEKITNIYVPVAKSAVPSYKTEKFKNWEISTFLKAAGVNSGDFTLTLELRRQKQAFMIGDAAGKGNDAAIVAIALQAAFVATLKTLNPDHITTNGVRLAVEAAYRTTIPTWKAGPSLIFGMIDNINNFVEFLSFGMPTIVGIKKGKLEYHKQVPDLAMLGSKDNPRELTPVRVQLNQGESIFLFTDGFVESFDSHTPKRQQNLFSRYLEAATFFSDDSEAILKNLVEGGTQSSPIYTNAEDDMSAMIILNRKGK